MPDPVPASSTLSTDKTGTFAIMPDSDPTRGPEPSARSSRLILDHQTLRELWNPG